MDKKDIGTFGERMAGEWMKQNGYAIIERNYRCRAGEQAPQIAIQDILADLRARPLNALISWDSEDCSSYQRYKRISFPFRK